MIDSHCHLGIGAEWKTPDTLPFQALERAHAAGVQGILTVACSFEDIADLEQMIDQPHVWGAFGIHPENANLFEANHLTDTLESHTTLVALGEIGLDYFYAPEERSKQIKVFEKQIETAAAYQLPIIIHTRDAEEDTIQILQAAERGDLLKAGAVLHCFTGSEKLCEKALELGLYISASGIITFKKADALRSIFQTVPNDRLLVETDSPYLAPVPYRGKMNEPAYVIETAKQLAMIKNLSFAQLDEITTKNFQNLFKIKEKI